MCVYEWRAGPLSGVSLQCGSINSGSSSSSRRISMDDGDNTKALYTRSTLRRMTDWISWMCIHRTRWRWKEKPECKFKRKLLISFSFNHLQYAIHTTNPIHGLFSMRMSYFIWTGRIDELERSSFTFFLCFRFYFCEMKRGGLIPFLSSLGSDESSHSFFHGKKKRLWKTTMTAEERRMRGKKINEIWRRNRRREIYKKRVTLDNKGRIDRKFPYSNETKCSCAKTK